jgi:glycosyltransferase involved in cell wall biosynthesis
MRYAVIVLTRNDVSKLELTLTSILSQSLQPTYVCVVNDGSTDFTDKLLERFLREKQGKFSVVSLPDRGYDIRRIPANLNMAYSHLEAAHAKFDYSMISNDDCIFPSKYSELILTKMESDRKLGIASGQCINCPMRLVKMKPRGTGRFVREELWVKVGRRYPVAYGWETWLLYKALQLGYGVENFSWLRFHHLRVIGSAHRFRHWGPAMRALGYHPFIAIGGPALNVLHLREPMPLSNSISMLASYLFPGTCKFDFYQQEYDSGLRCFVRRHQATQIAAFVSKQISKVLA